jgi:antitoxin component YwqK of YwqJK toxin-antitoxin module
MKTAGPFLIVLFFFSSCMPGQEKKEEPRIAKTVPAVFVEADDSILSKHQDTLYSGDHFFTGHCYALYPGGDTAILQSYFNGVEEGAQYRWYEGGQLAEKRNYINGKKEGVQQGWWPDGKQKFLFNTVNDEYEGEFREWYSSGLMGKQFHYKNGKEEGSQQLWWDNGTIRANYVIRNGRKYGLLGLKTCVNPYDSVFKK